jgi:hypothetical protein
VRVVDAAGAPAAGAYVTWFDEESHAPRDLDAEPALTGLRRARGKTVVTDAKGATRVGEFVRVVASAGDAYAVAWYARSFEPLTLKLAPARSLGVTTVDREGRPVAGVRICLRERERSNGSHDEWRVKTGADGAATIGPVDLFAALENASELFVAVDGPLAKPLAQRFVPRELPAAPIRFVMPPAGRLVIDVVDAQGQPLDSVDRIDFREPYRREGDELPATRGGAAWLKVPCYSSAAAPHYEIDHVETGLTFVVDARADAIEDVEQTVIGPAKAGETVHVKLVGAPRDRITARLLDEQGRAFAGRRVDLHSTTSARRWFREFVGSGRSDERGAITIPLSESGRLNFAKEVDFHVEVVVRDVEHGRIVANGFFPATKATRLASCDLGEVRLHPAPFLVRGVVVDDAGASVAGAHLSVGVGPTEEESKHAGWRGHMYDSVLDAVSGNDGTFEIFGDVPDGRLFLNANVEARRGVASFEHSFGAAFTAGATDLKITLWRCGTIVGRVVGDPEEIQSLSWHVESVRADGSTTSTGCGFNDLDGTFVDDAPVGKASVEISRRGTPIAKFPDLEIKPGAVVRLPPVELAASAHQCELTIVDDVGKPVDSGWIAMPDPSEEKEFADGKKMFPPGFRMFPRRADVTSFRDGRATLRSDQELRPFAVGALGRTAVVVMHPAAAEHIVLEPAPRIALVLDYDGDATPDGTSFLVSLAIPDDDPAWFRNGPDETTRDFRSYPGLDDIELARAKPVEMPVRSLGALELRLVLGRKMQNGYSGAGIACAPARVEVRRGSEPQTIHVRVERAAIEAALRRIPDSGEHVPR